MKRFLAIVLFLSAVLAHADVPALSGLYFGETGCGHCDVFLHSQKEAIEKRYGVRIELETFDILKTEEYAHCVRLLDKRGLKFRAFPVLFLGENVYQGNAAIESNLGAEIEFYLKEGRYRPRVLDSADIGGFTARTVPVFLAGLLDGVNPCAFSTLLFFLSFLALRKKSGRALLAAGSAFILSVFSVYFLIGMGLLSGLHALRARRGSPEDASLKLPAALSRANHFIIRRFASTPAIVAGAAFCGAAVSVLELACTGQIYFPTLAYINRTAPTSSSVFLLAVYNVAFVLPLTAVFLLFFLGTAHERLRLWYRDRVFLVRLLTALFFFAMAALIWIV